jgi:hypothetical protein
VCANETGWVCEILDVMAKRKVPAPKGNRILLVYPVVTSLAEPFREEIYNSNSSVK